jgi:hypothetical protein
MAQEPVFVIVSGGCVQDCPSFVEVIDFDNLIGDVYTVGDCERGWENLSEAAQNYVRTVYPDECGKIQARIVEDRRVTGK